MNDIAGRDLIARLMDGYLSTQLIYVAAQLGLADLLRDGPRSSAELAALTGTKASTLHRVLRGLVVDGVLDEAADGRFAITDAGRLLEADRPDSTCGAVIARAELYYHAAAALIETVRHGGSAFHHAHGVEFFEALAARPDRNAAFQASMTARSKQEVGEILRAYDFSRFRHIVDVGGGRGVLIASLLKNYPLAHATLFDRPEVVEDARVALEMAGVASRCAVIGGDFFAAVPGGGDLYVLSRVVHDWEDDAAIRILGSCRRAMADDATLLLAEAVLPERAGDLPAAIRMDLHMLTLVNGKERTQTEFERVLSESGLQLKRTIEIKGQTGLSLVEAVPKV
jgi:O-methyltransferase domain/Dimerisation domain